MKMKMMFGLAALAVITLTAIGCQDPGQPTEGPENVSQQTPATKSTYAATTEPSGALPVGEAREKTVDGEEVTLVGLVGGSSKPFIEGLAAFTIVDAKVPYCAAEEGCPTPWDYCCQTAAVKENIATIKVVDDKGKPVMQDARELLDVEELSTVVVNGKATRDAQGNLSVAAKQVFVQKGN